MLGRIKMPLSTEIGLGPGHIALDGDPAPPKRRHSPTLIFGPCVLWQTAGWIKMSLGRKVGLSPGDIVLDRDPAPPPKKKAAQQPHSPTFRPISIVAKQLDESRGHLVGLGPGDIVLDGDPAPCPKRGHSSPPVFGPCLLWRNGRPSQ